MIEELRWMREIYSGAPRAVVVEDVLEFQFAHTQWLADEDPTHCENCVAELGSTHGALEGPLSIKHHPLCFNCVLDIAAAVDLSKGPSIRVYDVAVAQGEQDENHS